MPSLWGLDNGRSGCPFPACTRRPKQEYTARSKLVTPPIRQTILTQPATDIWALPEERIYEALGTSPKGLTEDDAFSLLQQHGKNVLPTKVGRPIIFKFLDQFTSLFAIMLEVAAVLVFIAAMLSTGASRQDNINVTCLLYTSPSPRDGLLSRMPSSA